MGKGAGGLHVQFSRLRHHAAEQGDVGAIHGRVEVFLGQLVNFLVLDLSGIEVLFLCVLGKCPGLSFGEEVQGVLGQRLGDGLATGLGLFFAGAPFQAGLAHDFVHFLGAHGERNAEIMQGQPNLALPALGTDPGTGGASDDGGLGRAHVVAVEAGDRKRLQDVIFDTGILQGIFSGHYGVLFQVRGRKGW